MTCCRCNEAFDSEELSMGLVTALRVNGKTYRMHLQCSREILLEWIKKNIPE